MTSGLVRLPSVARIVRAREWLSARPPLDRAFWPAVLLTAASLVLGLGRWALWTPTGLSETFFSEPGQGGQVLREQRSGRLDLGILEEDVHLPRRFFSIRWRGVWRVSVGGPQEIFLGGDDAAILQLDGQVVLERNAEAGFSTISKTVVLQPGFHRLEVDYQQEGGGYFLNVRRVSPGGSPRPFDPDALFPAVPGARSLAVNDALCLAGLGLKILWLLMLGFAGGLVLLRLDRHARVTPGGARAVAISAWRALASSSALRRFGRGVAVALPAVVFLYAGALRLDALLSRYGPLEHPAWAREVQLHAAERVARLRPPRLGLSPVPNPYVGGDPFTYIRSAREMRGFYAGSVREPVFLLVTRWFLRLLDQQDVAVSFASASFSLLAVVATWLLGRLAVSRWVGLLAALGMAIEARVISWGVDGWRDDAFTFFMVLSAYALLRCYRRPSIGNAMLAGVVGAGACLTRITSLSFLLPGLLCLLFVPRDRRLRDRLRTTLAATGVMAVLIAPYLVNCARAYGDPFYAINYHTAFYESREGRAASPSVLQPGQESVARYVGSRLRARPLRTIDTLASGLTAYPFDNKWEGFEGWWPGLGSVLRWSAPAGLLLMLMSGEGRLLLLLLVASLAPYAFTWNIRGGAEWRFTMHAYPVFLIAAFLAWQQAIGFVRRGDWTDPSRAALPPARRLIGPAVVVLVIVTGFAAWREAPWFIVREAIAAGDAGTVTLGERDQVFLGEGWSQPTQGAVAMSRFAAREAVLWVPLPRQQDYVLRLHLGELEGHWGFGIAVALNLVPIGRVELPPNTRDVTAELQVPVEQVRAGSNRIDLRAERGVRANVAGVSAPGLKADAEIACRVWSVTIVPGHRGTEAQSVLRSPFYPSDDDPPAVVGRAHGSLLPDVVDEHVEPGLAGVLDQHVLERVPREVRVGRPGVEARVVEQLAADGRLDQLAAH
jgi:hypothetical protein